MSALLFRLVEMSENPVISFPIRKRMHTEMFISGRAELYIQKRGDNLKVGAKTNNRWE